MGCTQPTLKGPFTALKGRSTAAERRKQRLHLFSSRIRKEQQEKQDTVAKIEKLLTSFISKYYSVGPGLKTSTEEFRHAFNKFAPDCSLSSKDLVAQVKAMGFTKRQLRPTPDSDCVQCFEGICLLKV